MINLIVWEIKRRKKYILWWTIGISLTLILILSIYPSIRDQYATFNNLIKKLPSSIMDLKTGGSSSSFASPIGYLNSQIYFATMPLFLLIMSIGLGGSVLGNDEKDHTLELILSRSISRTKLIISKLIATFVILFIPVLTSSVVISITSSIINIDVPQKYLLLADFYLLMFTFMFGLIAFSISSAVSVSKRIGAATSSILAFSSYILTSLAGMNHYVLDFAKLLPWYYFSPSNLLNGVVSNNLSIYIITVIVIAILISIIGFNKRDIG